MQVRKRGKRYQLIRTEYIPEKKRTFGRVVDSLDSYMPKLTDEVKAKLSAEEVKQVEEKLVDIRKEQLDREAEDTLRRLDELVSTASLALAADNPPEWLSNDKAKRIYESIDDLERKLRRHGFKKRALARPERSTDKKKAGGKQQERVDNDVQHGAG